jgi:hypothetical protein
MRDGSRRAAARPLRRVTARPAATRGHTAVRTLDQETAMRLEQRHMSSRRRLSGRHERGADSHRLNERRIKLVYHNANRLRFARVRQTRDARGLRRTQSRGMGRGRRTAAGHPARAGNLAAAASFGQPIDRLHLHQRGAEDGKQKPDQAFHVKRRKSLMAIRATIFFERVTL